MKINNRRYIGCKTKLLDEIYNLIINYGFKENDTFTDLFAGTGVVGYKFASMGFKTILNDSLYSNYVAYNAFLGQGKVDSLKINKFMSYFNSIDGDNLDDNYFSSIYGDKYFSFNDSKKIGYIREEIEKKRNELNDREYFYLLTSLMYATDKIANTVGHFESFLSQKPNDKGVEMKPIEIDYSISPAEIFNCDSNELILKIKSDIVYIDPPYNARQYVNFYHVLENLCRWDKPNNLEGNSMKFKRDNLKSGYCRKKAPELFKDLIENADAKLIVVSYNNTYTAGSVSSINTITEEEIISILSKKGKVVKKEIVYKAFNAGKTAIKEHKEYLFACEVNKK